MEKSKARRKLNFEEGKKWKSERVAAQFPNPIRKLDEAVINRIAAGEIIQRPANAVKELIENSLDAGATEIEIKLKNAGLTRLQISDNGYGIQKNDLNIVCHRFTTSKLTRFEDLKTIATFGFRGEALASVSHIANVTIITKTDSDEFAHKAIYAEGKLISMEPYAAAGRGTRVIAENLFSNTTRKKRLLDNANGEREEIADLVGRYAIHNARDVGFTLRKDDHVTEIKTIANSTKIENIRRVYGHRIAKNLEYFRVDDEVYKFAAEGYVSNASCPLAKQIIVIFANGRLVRSKLLKKMAEHVYGLFLPKRTHAFVYLSLNLDPRTLDANVHPSKEEVRFAHEERIADIVKREMERKLSKCPVSRPAKRPPKAALPEVLPEPKGAKRFAEENRANRFGREINLTSVLKARERIEKDSNATLKEILADFSHVATLNTTWSVIKHRNQLFICDNHSLAGELFYQILVNNFGDFGKIRFKEPISLSSLIWKALNSPHSGWTGKDDEKEEAVSAAVSVISRRAHMLRDYFSMEIDEGGNLLTIPYLLENYIPEEAGMATYALNLASKVTWKEETACLEEFCRETAAYFAHQWKVPSDSCSKEEICKLSASLVNVLYPAIRGNLTPSNELFESRAVLKIASLPALYKYFGRSKC